VPAPRSRARKLRIGLVPLISSGPIFVAQAKGFFEKVNLDVEVKYFADGALAIPALIAGELDATVSTLNAGLFNAVSKGAPYRLILDRGSEKPGSGSMTIAASNAMVTAGMTAPNKMALLKGKRLAIQAPGGIDQYLLGLGAQRAGLDPRSDVEWSTGLAYPDIVKAMGAGQVDAANIPVPLGFLVERNNFGKLVFSGLGHRAEYAARLLGDVAEISRGEQVRRGALRDGAHPCGPPVQQGGRRQGRRRHQDRVGGDQGAGQPDRGGRAALDLVLRGRQAEHRLLHGAGKILDRHHEAGQRLGDRAAAVRSVLPPSRRTTGSPSPIRSS
jgi:hypothetical protein